MNSFTMPYLKPLVLFCLSAGCYARNVVPTHNNKNFENNNNDHIQTFYQRMEAEKTTELEKIRHLHKSPDHPPIMVNNVSISLSSIYVHQGGTIDISFTTTNGEFPSYDCYLLIVNDDVVFNTTNYYEWSRPDSNARPLYDLTRYNPATMKSKLLYDNTTGVLSGLILPYYPAKLKAVLFNPGYDDWYANYILGESQVFETIDSDMTIVATQKDRQVTFNVEATAPIASRYYWYIIILASETVPDRMDIDPFVSYKPVYNYSSFPDNSDGQMVAEFGGSDKIWPKGDYKMIAFVDGPFTGFERYHIAVSNTISVKSTVCKQNKGKCKDISDCCGGDYGNLECKKIKYGPSGRLTRKQCAKRTF